ncbi:MAG: hypothetical protein ACLFR8_03600 [Alkalispirochaeta sp.]
MYKSAVFLIFATVFLLAPVVSGFARGAQEDPIRQARELVAENRINEAILLLEQTVRDDPERIQQAEALLRTIREIRGEYNVLFDQLIDNLVNNPDDIERTLEIIDRMEALDEFPNERVVEQIEDARIVAQLAYDRNFLDERMDEALALLRNGGYADAIDIYVGLRDLQRERFEVRGYGDIFLNSVDSVVARVPEVSSEFQSILPDYRSAGERVERSAERASGIDDEALDAFIDEAAEVASILDDAEAIAAEIAVLRSQVPLQFPDVPVDWYLNFQETITRGRPDLRGEEGIVYAISAAYRESMAPLVAAGRDPTRSLVDEGDRAASGDRYDEALEAYTRARSSALIWRQAEAAQIGIFDEDFPPADLVETYAPDAATPVITARGYLTAVESLVPLAEVMALFVETGTDREDTLFSLESRKDATNAIVATLRDGASEWENGLEPYRELPGSYTPDEVADLFDGISRRWDRNTARAVSREQELVERIALLETDAVPDVIEELTGSLTGAVPLVTGAEEPIEGGDGATRFARYPDAAEEIYRTVIDGAEENIELVGAATARIAEEPEYVVDGAPVQRAQDRLDELDEELQEILTAAEGGLSEAQSLIARSNQLIEEAEEQTADMRAAIAATQVNAARNNFEAIRDSYFESLELRENPEFRREVDAIIEELGAELQELENLIVVQRVRELLTQANELYNQDEYVSARDTLLEAQQTWEQTNVEPNTEIDRLLRLVTAALSLEEGRELTITDPLYPILSNYLSIAREDYNRGVELYEDGRETRAEPLFDRAIENLRNVRDVRPLNWDARILELRISQIRNADDFDEVFAARYEQALGRLDETGPLEVYSELEVLAEINPDYPGIQEQIRRLEIALNLRPDPVDQARRQQAATLYNRAQTLSTGSLDQANVAVSLLEEAVELDPTNGDAAFLLDQLRIRLGGQATVALTTADEQQYRRAETLFSQGQVLQALQIVERLLQDAENQNYPPLVDLRRRIALRLGI